MSDPAGNGLMVEQIALAHLDRAFASRDPFHDVLLRDSSFAADDGRLWLLFGSTPWQLMKKDGDPKRHYNGHNRIDVLPVRTNSLRADTGR